MKKWFLFPLVIFVFGCGRGEHRPAGVLDREAFKEALLQAELIEARSSRELTLARDPGMGRQRGDYDVLFKDLGITEAQFDSTFAYYSARPLELKSLYEEILAELGKRKDGLPQ